MLEISIRTRSLRCPLLDLISIFDRGITSSSGNVATIFISLLIRDTPRRKLVGLLINSFGRTMNASLYFIIFSARVISTIRVSIRSLRGKGLRKEIISSERGVILSKSNSIRQSVSKEGNWPCIRVKYYPIRGRWKNRKEFAEARSYKSREAATRWTPSH